MSAEQYDLEERLLEYAARIIRLAENVTRTPAGQHIALQVLRSGTSPLPNHAEAQAAESNRDFIHKLKISLKGAARNPELAAVNPESSLGEKTRTRGSTPQGDRRIDPHFRRQHQNRPKERQMIVSFLQSSKFSVRSSMFAFARS